MYTQEIDESEFFHQDFSTASEWESFNARLEETFHEVEKNLLQLNANNFKPKIIITKHQ